MRRTRFLVPALSILAAAAVAVPVALAAGEQVNTYTVTGSVKGGKGATKKKPKPVSLSFDYTVGEKSGLRPAPVNKYSIFFQGGQVNTSAFPGCDADKLTEAGDPSVCPKKSIMGDGKIIAEVGQPSNTADKSLYCYLSLTLVNSTRKNHFLLFLKGVQTDPDPKKTCVTQIAEPIDAKFVKRSGGTSLDFTVQPNLLHPAGLDNAVTQVTSNIKKVSTKKNGKTVGFFEGYSCKKNKTAINVTFTQETDGVKTTAKSTGACN